MGTGYLGEGGMVVNTLLVYSANFKPLDALVLFEKLGGVAHDVVEADEVDLDRPAEGVQREPLAPAVDRPARRADAMSRASALVRSAISRTSSSGRRYAFRTLRFSTNFLPSCTSASAPQARSIVSRVPVLIRSPGSS